MHVLLLVAVLAGDVSGGALSVSSSEGNGGMVVLVEGTDDMNPLPKVPAGPLRWPLTQDGGWVPPGVTTTPAPESGSEANPGALVGLLTKAAKERNWAVLAGALLMLAVLVLRRLKPTIPKKWLPAVGLALACVPGLALELLEPDGLSVEELVEATLTIWLLASGLWGVMKQGQKKAENAESPPVITDADKKTQQV